jgi:hypothetical protein
MSLLCEGAWSGYLIALSAIMRIQSQRILRPSSLEPDFCLADGRGSIQGKIGQKLHDARQSGKAVELDYEPLQALAGMLVDPKFVDRRAPLKGLIGGGPQVAKVYPYLRTMHYAVEWEVGSKSVNVLKGRVIADFEIITTLGINPFTGEVHRPVRGPTEPSLEMTSLG